MTSDRVTLMPAASPWLDRFPAGWRETRFRYVASINRGQVDPREAPWSEMTLMAPNHIESGTGRILATETAAEQGADSGKYKVAAGQVVYSKIRPALNKVAIAPADCLCSADMYAMAFTEQVDVRFAEYFMLARPFHTFATVTSMRVKMPKINREDLADAPWLIPPTAEQRAIVSFVDRETTRIDTLIEEQQRLIDMLQERRIAITEGVVAALDWSIPLRIVTALIQTGPFGSQLKSDEYVEGGTSVINPSHLVNGSIRPDERIAVGASKAAELARHALHPGDVVVARRGEIGRCAVVRPRESGLLCGTGSALVRPDANAMDPDFLALVFGSRRNRDALSLASVGSTMENLNSQIIGAVRIPCPPLSEQRQIVEQATEATDRLDTLIAETERFIELARERRSALITAAVTGQIDVRTEVA